MNLYRLTISARNYSLVRPRTRVSNPSRPDGERLCNLPAERWILIDSYSVGR
jgi:hypothetical protein